MGSRRRAAAQRRQGADRPADPAGGRSGPPPSLRPEAGDEDYALSVTPEAAVIGAKDLAGLVHGLATLATGPRPTAATARFPAWWSAIGRASAGGRSRTTSPAAEHKARAVEARPGPRRAAKLNLFTYMQSQFAFRNTRCWVRKTDRSRPRSSPRLVEHGRPLGIDILGNQQSFAHMQHAAQRTGIRRLEGRRPDAFARQEGTYALLDDLYSEVLPILPFEMFNVCCDETWGLGTSGPSKELADKIGPGGVYVRHIRRVYDLVHGKYGKRMMMWGDIILKHPDKLAEIPKDVVMLTWGYGARQLRRPDRPLRRLGL